MKTPARLRLFFLTGALCFASACTEEKVPEDELEAADDAVEEAGEAIRKSME